jgi:hypothetical protein
LFRTGDDENILQPLPCVYQFIHKFQRYVIWVTVGSALAVFHPPASYFIHFPLNNSIPFRIPVSRFVAEIDPSVMYSSRVGIREFCSRFLLFRGTFPFKALGIWCQQCKQWKLYVMLHDFFLRKLNSPI